MSQSNQSSQFRTSRRRTVSGLSIGIIVLDTTFTRLEGDIANGMTWDFPVQFRVVSGVTPAQVIEGDPSASLQPFVEAIHELVAIGVDGITTSCGFLAAIHPVLREVSPVPLATSSLMQIPMVEQILPAGQQLAVLAADESALTKKHFQGVGAMGDYLVGELDFDGAIRKNMRENVLAVDYEEQLADVLAATERLLLRQDNIGALVLECANLAPYSAAIQERFQVPVYDIVSLVHWFHEGLRPTRFNN